MQYFPIVLPGELPSGFLLSSVDKASKGSPPSLFETFQSPTPHRNQYFRRNQSLRRVSQEDQLRNLFLWQDSFHRDTLYLK